MQGISDLFVECYGETLRRSRIALRMAAPAPDVDLALDLLLERSYIAESSGDRGAVAYHQVRPYRAVTDPASEFYQGDDDGTPG